MCLRVWTDVFLGIAVPLLLVACERLTSTGGKPTSVFIITPAQDPFIQAFADYVDRLEGDGLETKTVIEVEKDAPFIFIMRPAGSQEVSDEEMKEVMELVMTTVNVFESREGLRNEDIDIAFVRPENHRIVVVKDNDMPDLLDDLGEVTISVDNKYFTSIVNRAGPAKNGSQEFANTWAVIQAICLAYAGDFKDSDAVCNIFSANAAAGWVGMEAGEAEQLINSYGSTDLGYLGSGDYKYRYIDFVVDEFRRDK